MNDLLAKYINKLKSPKTLIIIGLIGIALIFLSSLGGNADKQTHKSDNTEISAEEYREQLEKDIKKINFDIAIDFIIL